MKTKKNSALPAQKLGLARIQEKCLSLTERVIKKNFGSNIVGTIEQTPDEKLGDFAFPCFALAKELKKSPIEIARDIATSIKKLPSEIQSVSAVGPYVNFFLNPKELASKILGASEKEKKVKKETIVIEYVSPNTNKPLHLGHVRNAVLGDSVARLNEFLENKVVRTCLINDRGVHICKSMVAYQSDKSMATPQSTGKKGDHLVGDYYVLYETLLKKDPSMEEKARECLKLWETGDKQTHALWKKMNAWVIKGMNETYKKLGITFDRTYLESEMYLHGKDIIMKGLAEGLFKKDETGAVYADLEQFNLPNKVLLRRDGTSIYITQEIYLALKKLKDYKPSMSIYVVMSEQDLYFRQFFAVLKLLKVPYADNLIHLSYGMVRLPEGRMKSREGTVVDADDLIDEIESLVTEEIKKRDEKITAKELRTRAQRIALAALKYYLLIVGPSSDMIFNPKESIALHGRTGPYLLYTYARLRNIVRKAGRGTRNEVKKNTYAFTVEKKLLVHLLKFEETIHRATKESNPSLLATYLGELAQDANDYYHSTPVLKAKNNERVARLLLIDKITGTLKIGLDLLGIQTIERM